MSNSLRPARTSSTNADDASGRVRRDSSLQALWEFLFPWDGTRNHRIPAVHGPAGFCKPSFECWTGVGAGALIGSCVRLRARKFCSRVAEMNKRPARQWRNYQSILIVEAGGRVPKNHRIGGDTPATVARVFTRVWRSAMLELRPVLVRAVQ